MFLRHAGGQRRQADLERYATRVPGSPEGGPHPGVNVIKLFSFVADDKA